MTTMTTPTPTPIRTHHVRAALLAVIAALGATAVVMGTWTLIGTQSNNPTTINPVVTQPSAPQLTLAEKMMAIEAALPPSVYPVIVPVRPLPAPAQLTVEQDLANIHAILAGLPAPYLFPAPAQLTVEQEVANIHAILAGLPAPYPFPQPTVEQE